MRSDYKTWLQEQKYDAGTITAQLHRAGRVEDCYGSLDDHFAKNTLQSVIDDLSYSAEDERRQRPNQSRIPFKGNTRNNLASYKNAVVRYRKFLTGGWDRSDIDAPLVYERPLATAVETVSTLRQQALKSSLGDPDWLRFFTLMGTAIAIREHAP